MSHRKQPRFLCDEMLGQVCRYLRAAGYDTLLASGGMSDTDLLKLCHTEDRIFLTRDARVAEHRAARGVALILPHASLDDLAALLEAQFRLNWLRYAFTRCLLDNTPLVAADAAARARAPDDALKPGEPLSYCPACGRIYWHGSHYKRMREKLTSWQTLKQ